MISKFVYLIICLLFAYIGQTILKIVIDKCPKYVRDFKFIQFIFINTNTYLGLFFIGIGFIFWSFFLKNSEISKAVPILAISYLPWLIIGHIFFNEKITKIKLLATLFICLGVWLLF